MKNWFNNIKAPKYLRYLFFIAYSFYRRFTSERSTAHDTAILFLAFIHILLYSGLYIYMINPKTKTSMILVLIFTGIQFYFWFWHNKKWKLYIKEYNHINRRKQNVGVVFLLVYLLVCYYIGIEVLIIKNGNII